MATVTENKSGSLYVTLSLSKMDLKILMKRFIVVLVERDTVLLPIEESMFSKLKDYEKSVCTYVANVARIIDPRFTNDLIRDDEILRLLVTLQSLPLFMVTEEINPVHNQKYISAILLNEEDKTPLAP